MTAPATTTDIPASEMVLIEAVAFLAAAVGWDEVGS